MEDSGFLDPSALARLAAAVNGGASADLGYAGEDSLVADGGRGVAFFKPGWSPELLASTDYVGPLVGVSPHATRSALDAEPDPPATIYDLLLRLVDTWTEADGRSAGRPWNATWGTTCAAGRRIKRHGLVLLEAHCVAPEVARCHLGALHSVAFDTYHGLSHQYPIEHSAFLGALLPGGRAFSPPSTASAATRRAALSWR